MIIKDDAHKTMPNVEEYSFRSIGKRRSEGVSDHIFPTIDENMAINTQKRDDEIRLERELESGSAFTIDPNVKQLRGHDNQVKRDWEESVESEVEKRLKQLEADIRKMAYEEGFQKGLADAKAETMEKHQQQLEEFANMLESTNESIREIYEKNKIDNFRIAKNLTKWVILKEIKDDQYLERLLEKLIHEINSKNNLLIKIDNQHFSSMPEIVELVEERLGKLTNIRIERALDLNNKGIILESDNGIIDASIEAQFSTIDEIFKTVGVIEGDSDDAA